MPDSMEARFARLVQRSDALKAAEEERGRLALRTREAAQGLFGRLLPKLAQFHELLTPAGPLGVHQDVDNALAVQVSLDGRAFACYEVRLDVARPSAWVQIDMDEENRRSVDEAAEDLMRRVEGLFA